jgi:hypothetical protein
VHENPALKVACPLSNRTRDSQARDRRFRARSGNGARSWRTLPESRSQRRTGTRRNAGRALRSAIRRYSRHNRRPRDTPRSGPPQRRNAARCRSSIQRPRYTRGTPRARGRTRDSTRTYTPPWRYNVGRMFALLGRRFHRRHSPSRPRIRRRCRPRGRKTEFRLRSLGHRHTARSAARRWRRWDARRWCNPDPARIRHPRCRR